MKKISVPKSVIADTVRELSLDGKADTERFLLWLGDSEERVIREIFVPPYEASSDYFHISEQDMGAIFRKLRASGLSILAQVHSHPMEAFHSYADDTWAIVRHVGALSIVLPYFARNTDEQNFLTETAVFELSSNNRWQELSREDMENFAII